VHQGGGFGKGFLLALQFFLKILDSVAVGFPF